MFYKENLFAGESLRCWPLCKSKDMALIKSLRRIFTRYSIRTFILVAMLPMFFCWLVFCFSGIRVRHMPPEEVRLFLIALCIIPVGRFWATQAPLPDSLFARLVPMFLPTLLAPLAYIPFAGMPQLCTPTPTSAC